MFRDIWKHKYNIKQGPRATLARKIIRTLISNINQHSFDLFQSYNL